MTRALRRETKGGLDDIDEERIEAPALGSPEAAVMGCVSMLAAITHQNERYLAYWLDAYYQARRHYEESLQTEATDLTVTEKKPEPKPAPKPKAEQKKAEPAKQPGKLGNHNAAEAARYKREVLEKLRAARASGITAHQIEEAAGNCSVLSDDVFAILDGSIRGIAVYRAIDAALEKLAIQH